MKKVYKKIIFGIFCLLIIFLVSYILKNNSKENKISPGVLGLPEVNEESSIDLPYRNKILRINWFVVNKTDNLFLFVNSDKLTSREFIEKNNCSFLSSGGYYKKDYLPTGLLISEYQEKSPFVNSSLINGIFSVNDFATPRITSQVPRDRLRIALQAGPMLKENGNFIDLSLKNDEEARRVVLGVTGENIAVFMIVYNKDSFLIGPYLDDLPGILERFEEETGIIFADVVNLDGGTPTVFINSDQNIVESTIVGSYFCVK